MASWKKHLTVVRVNGQANPRTGGPDNASEVTASGRSGFLPEIYAGHPNRIQRYYQYEDMDRDSDIALALDTIADFCTQSEEQSDKPFEIKFADDANDTEVKLVEACLDKWLKVQDFRSRLWTMFRNALKNGDAFFLRDPETGEWLWLDHFQVVGVKVDDENGKDPEEYLVRNLDYNKRAKFATTAVDPSSYNFPMGASQAYTSRIGVGGNGAPANASQFALAGAHIDPRAQKAGMQKDVQDIHVVSAEHVVHLSLSAGMDINWPFGASVLESVFKVFRQKELLEDAILIYRIQRAPERRVFYIDVGNMSPYKAKAHIQQIKNEIHQRRIPGRTASGGSMIDSAYNPLCLDLATRIPLLDGRTRTIAELAEEFRAGQQNWVYSCDPETGAVVPGPITWAGVTRTNAQIIRLVLDTGATLTCTPDHKVPVRGKGFVEAQHLTPEDCLFAFETRRVPMGEGQRAQIYDPAEQAWVWTHRLVGDFFGGTEDTPLTWAFDDGAPLLDLNLDGSARDAAQFDRYVVRIEDAGMMDVGTITVDGEEIWHKHHTFATEAGVFVKNSLMDDFFLATTPEGRGSKVDVLPGAQNLGDIGDLDFFNRKLARGLRIPPSYLSMNDDKNQTPHNDGKIGAAMIQEYRFSKYCLRIQNLLAPTFDSEFKIFMKNSGIEIEDSVCELLFNPPQSFSKYRQIEIDSAQVGVYQQLADNKKLSERFKLQRFLNLTQAEILENQRLWGEENKKRLTDKESIPSEGGGGGAMGLSAVGLRPGGDDMSFGGGEPGADAGADMGADMGGDLGGGLGGAGGLNSAPPAAGAAGAMPGGPGGAAPPA